MIEIVLLILLIAMVAFSIYQDTNRPEPPQPVAAPIYVSSPLSPAYHDLWRPRWHGRFGRSRSHSPMRRHH